MTKDVPVDSLRIERAEQTTKDGWAKRFREVMSLKKAGKARAK